MYGPADLSKKIPTPKTLDDYDNREFSLEDDAGISSFGYLVGLMRVLDHIIRGTPRDSEENIKALCANVDAGIEAWRSLLPKHKCKLVNEDGTRDELLFKAHMLTTV